MEVFSEQVEDLLCDLYVLRLKLLIDDVDENQEDYKQHRSDSKIEWVEIMYEVVLRKAKVRHVNGLWNFLVHFKACFAVFEVRSPVRVVVD